MILYSHDKGLEENKKKRIVNEKSFRKVYNLEKKAALPFLGSVVASPFVFSLSFAYYV